MGEVYGPLLTVPVLQESEENKSTFQVEKEFNLVTMVENGNTYRLHFWEFLQEELQGRSYLSTGRNAISIKDISRLLRAGLIKGIGKVSASRIVQRFGPDTLKILNDQPEELLLIEGIGPKRLALIRKNWHLQKSKATLHFFLKEHHISPQLAKPVFKQYHEKSIYLLQKHPYKVADQVTGFTLEDADKVALKANIPQDHPDRIQAYLLHQMQKHVENGQHTIPKIKILAETESLLGLNSKILEVQLGRLLEKEAIYQTVINTEEGPFEFLVDTAFSQAEDDLVLHLEKIENRPDNGGVEQEKLDSFLMHFKSHLSLPQEESVTHALNNKVHIISGGIASGKESVLKAIVDFVHPRNNQYLIVAPTQKAAKKLAARVNRKVLPFSHFAGKQQNPFHLKKASRVSSKLNLVVIWHADQLNPIQLVHLIKAIPQTSKLLLIGDLNQIPGPGCNNVFYHLYHSPKFSSFCLPSQPDLMENSERLIKTIEIIQGEFPKLKTNKEADFYFIKKEDTEEINNAIIGLVTKRLPKRCKLNPKKDIQVVSLMERGIIGTHQLNDLLQEALNPLAEELLWKGKIYRKGDKVIQLKDNYQKGVLKGEVGQIRRINHSNNTVAVFFGNRYVFYQINELEELELAYALTVEQFQRMEAPCIILPVHTSQYPMLFQQALYSAMSKATRLLVMVGTKKAVWFGVKNDKKLVRYSGVFTT